MKVEAIRRKRWEGLANGGKESRALFKTVYSNTVYPGFQRRSDCWIWKVRKDQETAGSEEREKKL